jgi:hypothetical protein
MGCQAAQDDPTSRSVEFWRQRIGRRLPELMRAGLIHREGERDGMSIWWPGPETVEVP